MADTNPASPSTATSYETLTTDKTKPDELALPVDISTIPKNPCTLSWKNLTYTVDIKKTAQCPNGKKIILSNVSGRCAPGELTAVMGPSGTRNIKTFRAVTSYVAQEDSLLARYPRLSLPNSITHQAIVERVQNVIDAMGLRVCEQHPSILLLDEPTSGLDSASTHNVMQFVSKLCQENKTVICTIHQPSSLVYEMFSNVVILTAGRRILGARQHIIDHFSASGYSCPMYMNPAEYFISLVNSDFEGHADIKRLIESYSASSMATNVVKAIESDAASVRNAPIIPVKPSALRQDLLGSTRMYTMLAFMVGTMYLYTNDDISDEDMVPLLFYVQAFLVFMSQSQRLQLRSIQLIASLPGIFLIALVSTLLVVLLSVAESLMHVIGAAVPHYIIGIALGAGVYGDDPDYWIWAYYLAFHTYSFQSFVYEHFIHAILVRLNLEDVDTAHNMIILAGYAVALELIFTFILYKFHTVKPTGITVHVDPPTTKNNYSNSAGKPLRVTTHPFTLSWSNLSYTVNIKKKTPKHPDGKKAILTNVTGRCAPGELTAVMGPSGSGKTTLLDILADRISSGTRNLKTFRAVSSYVAQEDSLLGSFTVRETLEMAAKLSLPSSITHHEIVERVQTVIDEMGLRVCEHTLAVKSARLSIAIELLSEPSILLLDEPTSGLDSASTYNVMKFVSRLCKENITVICTIHQPSSLVYDMFSNVVILTAGETVYFGPRLNMMSHFASLGYVCPEHEDPAEHYISIANTDFVGHGDIPSLVSGYAASPIAGKIQDAINADSTSLHGARAIERAPNSPLRQLVVLLKRNLIDNLRNPGIFWVRLVMYTQQAYHSSGLVYLLTYANCFLVFMSIAVLPFFIEQRAVFLRERANSNLNVFSYVIANFLVGYLAGLNSYGIFLLIVFLSLVVAESLMHLVAACVSQFIIGMAIGAALFGWFILCMGLFVPRPAIPDYWIWGHYLGFLSYGFEALMHNQFHNETSPEAQFILARFGMEDADLGRDLAIVAANAVAFEILFTFVLYKFHTGRR
ncbi:P-loop containing nucleoside triphosphate hydrolase [Phytophthora cactorum]|nr:P-loop containing nucleoside triphosphate hydrolase [Phytophthora cactorum]